MLRYTILVFILLSIQLALGENVCKICKDVLKSFVKQIEKTDTHSYDGGDVSYEEESLVSYRTSETRLMEIMDVMYHLYGAHKPNKILHILEPRLEEWWENDYRNLGESAVNLRNLTRKLCYNDWCCPDGEHGKPCTPCKPCNTIGGHCDGGGTSEGTGKCICDADYLGDACDQCTPFKTFRIERDGGLVECLNCAENCKGCTGPNPNNCIACAKGFHAPFPDRASTCYDLDECQRGEYNCSRGSRCLNVYGSYTCEACHQSCTTCSSPEPTQCDICAPGFRRHNPLKRILLGGHQCEDLNECAQNPDICPGPNEVCVNTDGSYRCDCKPSYTRPSIGQHCQLQEEL